MFKQKMALFIARLVKYLQSFHILVVITLNAFRGRYRLVCQYLSAFLT